MGWCLTNKQWRLTLLTPRTNFEQLNRRWDVNFFANTWICLWKKLHGYRTLHQDKIVLWQILNHGFFTYRCAQTWGVNLDACPCCNNQIEMTSHLFFECRNLRRKWATIAVTLVGTGLEVCFTLNSLWEIIKGSIVRACCSPIPIIIVVEMLNNIWRERNRCSYNNDHSQIPIRHLL